MDINLSTKSGFVAIVGRPNAGKSSLLNAVLGEKLAIVTEKPQTTRTSITGVLTRGDTQLVFIDTPGFHHPRNKLGEQMNRQVRRSVLDVDTAVFVTEAGTPLGTLELELIESIKKSGATPVAVLSKIDLLASPTDMLPKIQQLGEALDWHAVIPLSSLTGDGVDIFLKEITALAQEGPHYFDDDALTDQPERVIVAEIIREKILTHMQEEIPHGTAVQIDRMAEREGQPLLEILATIFCEKASHKGMIIGKNGAMLKRIASEARADIEAFLGIKVHMECWVKVKKDWRNENYMLRELGLEAPK